MPDVLLATDFDGTIAPIVADPEDARIHPLMQRFLGRCSSVPELAIAMLERGGHATAGMEAKNISVFQGPDAPVMDFVFTVCDQAAGEACPVWPGRPMTAHWGVEDPAAAAGAAGFRKRAEGTRLRAT